MANETQSNQQNPNQQSQVLGKDAAAQKSSSVQPQQGKPTDAKRSDVSSTKKSTDVDSDSEGDSAE